MAERFGNCKRTYLGKDAQGRKKWAIDVIGNDPLLNLQVGASADDCLTTDGPYWSTTNESFNAGKGGSGAAVESGARLSSVNIPQGATINVAYIILTCRLANSGTTAYTKIRCQKASNPSDFSGDDRDSFLARPRTSAGVDWDISDAWDVDTEYQSPSIVSVVQEVADSYEIASLVVFWADDGSDAGAQRRAYSYDGSPSKALKIHIEYTEPGQTHEASATLSGAGSLSATARRARSGSATLSGTGTLMAAGTVTGAAIYGSATLSGAGSLAASAVSILIGQATLTGEGSLSAQGKCTFVATAMLSGQGSLSVSATIVVFATVQFSGTGTLTASGVCIVIASATLSGVGYLTAAGQIVGLLESLIAAQKKPDRLPYVEAKVYDYEQGIKRLSWTRLYEGSEPDNHHGIAFDGQGSMHRIRAAADDKLYYQKVTDPDEDSDYSNWSLITNDCSGPCAIASYGAKVYIFYKTTANVLWKYYSHDYGQTWDDAQLVDYADVLSLSACWWGTGDVVVCFALKSNQLNGVTLDTGTQEAAQHTWSDGNHPLLDTYGIGATYNPFWPAIEIVFAGKESDTPYNHYDLFRTKFSNTYNFLALESFLMAPDGEDITYEYPDCHLPSGAQSYEANRIVAVEKFAGTTAYTRPLACHMVKGTYWSDTTFTEPKPFLDISSSYGLRLQSTGDYWWLERPDGVWRAPRPAASPLDLSKAIISLQQHAIALPRREGIPSLTGGGALAIELNNSKGQYSTPGEGALASLRFRSEIVLKLGYKTPEGNLALEAGTYWVDGWEWTSDSGLSTFRLICLDGWGLMDRWTARYQMRWNKDEVNPKSVWQILYQLLARVGVKLTNTPPKPQSSAINNFYPDFTVNPGTPGDTAIRRLLSFVPDKLVFRGQEAFTKNPLASESSCYSYKFPSPSRGEGQGEGAIHTILSGKYTDAVTVSRARAIGRDASGNRIIEEALDPDLSGLAIDILEQDYDPNLQTTARAQERADAILRTQQTQSTPATIVVPTNVGQELLDVVEVTDERCGISEEEYRVQAIRTDYDRRKGQYDQRLTIGAP
jgi:hypothetical protein